MSGSLANLKIVVGRPSTPGDLFDFIFCMAVCTSSSVISQSRRLLSSYPGIALTMVMGCGPSFRTLKWERMFSIGMGMWSGGC